MAGIIINPENQKKKIEHVQIMIYCNLICLLLQQYNLNIENFFFRT